MITDFITVIIVPVYKMEAMDEWVDGDMIV